ncbi:putative ABC transporter [Methanocella paludicola SANAE]|uniref:ABC transporter n=1 Tax=Methanocella paludicola (strain DSM 17711 / JCM 13418 / NBRC 101707 / SANAE) TaxID=304371 RepID=D1Z2Y3_METPS|nr:ABC transporter permease [Methanocella paludicola]BAI63055.1 putative ABC transporter [Methanocella paludicola SANAE]
MKPADVIGYALSDFSNNKFKTMMSSLGIIIGVMAIVVMLTLGDGLYSGVSQQFGDLDLDQMIVMPGGGSVQSGGMGMGMGFASAQEKSPAKFTDRDVSLLMGTSGVVEVTPRVSGSGIVTYGSENRSLSIQGVRPASETRLDGQIDKGRFLSSTDTYSVVIGSKIANGTFGRLVKTGTPITITNPMDGRSHQYTVVGILQESNGSMVTGDPNSNIYMTMDGIKAVSSVDSYSMIYVRAASASEAQATADNVEESLKRLHRNEGFTVITIKSFSDAINSIFDYIKYVLGGIAGISLVVGGIGILNVMMLTVKERTKEIGLMKAVGATTMDVRMLFLAESAMLGVVSGLIGLGLAAIISYFIGNGAGMPMPITLNNVLIGLGFGFITTTIAGVYPANKAATLDPIEALRTE